MRCFWFGDAPTRLRVAIFVVAAAAAPFFASLRKYPRGPVQHPEMMMRRIMMLVFVFDPSSCSVPDCVVTRLDRGVYT